MHENQHGGHSALTINDDDNLHVLKERHNNKTVIILKELRSKEQKYFNN